MPRAHDYYTGSKAKRAKLLDVKVSVQRLQGQPRHLAFEACARVGGSGGECGYGSTPRGAMAGALSKLAVQLRRRRSSWRK